MAGGAPGLAGPCVTSSVSEENKPGEEAAATLSQAGVELSAREITLKLRTVLMRRLFVWRCTQRSQRLQRSTSGSLSGRIRQIFALEFYSMLNQKKSW